MPPPKPLPEPPPRDRPPRRDPPSPPQLAQPAKPYIPKLVSLGNFKLENCGEIEESKARAAVREVLDLCNPIDDAVRPASLAETNDVVRAALAVFFGVVDDASYRQVRDDLGRLNAEHRAAITLVYRPDIKVLDEKGNPPKLADGTALEGCNVFGYVFGQPAGTGYRIVCGKPFIDDPTPYFASTTIYHEMSHKVLNTQDHGYGEQKCKECAAAGRGTTNADNYAFLAISIGTETAPTPWQRKPLPVPGATKPLPIAGVKKPLPIPGGNR